MNKEKVRNRFGILLLYILFAGIACVENDGLEHLDQPCFTKESLQTVPWIVDVLKPYSDPKFTSYIAVYVYNGEQFLTISHPFDCSPLGHVYNCNGVPLDSLAIDVKDFSDKRKLAAVLKK